MWCTSLHNAEPVFEAHVPLSCLAFDLVLVIWSLALEMACSEGTLGAGIDSDN
jgi:hypothetical protein